MCAFTFFIKSSLYLLLLALFPLLSNSTISFWNCCSHNLSANVESVQKYDLGDFNLIKKVSNYFLFSVCFISLSWSMLFWFFTLGTISNKLSVSQYCWVPNKNKKDFLGSPLRFYCYNFFYNSCKVHVRIELDIVPLMLYDLAVARTVAKTSLPTVFLSFLFPVLFISFPFSSSISFLNLWKTYRVTCWCNSKVFLNLFLSL